MDYLFRKWTDRQYTTLQNGKKDGKWVWNYDNGQIKMKGNHKNGKKDGQWTEWSTTGEKKYENTYKNGSKDGKWTTYNEDGTIKTVKEY